MHNNTHLSLDERKIIQVGIENRSTKKAIADTIGKDSTTIAKEIRAHRKLKPRNTYNAPVLCAKRGTCKPGRSCPDNCPDFLEPHCKYRDKSPGACNKCTTSGKCRMDKFLYNAETAHDEYRRDLAAVREGIALTAEDRDKIASVIAPLLRQGQSVHQIMSAHKEIELSERTLYHYIESGVFKSFGVDNFSLKEQVNRKQYKGKHKARKSPAIYTGHTYEDYRKFHADNPDTPTVEMDTVYNNPSGPYLQTFIFEKTPFMFGFLHNERTSASMAESFDRLQKLLGSELFAMLFSLILTDRGAEFEKIRLFELDSTGKTRLNIFYCDPMQSAQKPHVENNHNYVRDIIPNKYPLGCLTQADIDLMFSHINSTPRRVFGDKSPYELFCFLYGVEIANLLNIHEVKRDNVVLKPSLIFAKRS
ncbi:MAG: IS30 family transposase [Synergistaceae bacterium]|jgi:IS30 family transposase|nr:IS30 family transposase [Synergistaceae bacterium]